MSEKIQRLLIKELYQNNRALRDRFGAIQKIKRLAGDASTRSYFRLKTHHTSLVCALDAHQKMGASQKFLKVQDFLKVLGIRVPEVYDSCEQSGYVLQEDLGDRTMLSALGLWPKVKELERFYCEGIQQMARLHLKTHQKKGVTFFAEESFSLDFYLKEIETTFEYYFEHFLGLHKHKRFERLLDEFKTFLTPLESANDCLVHRDFHSRNIMIVDGRQVLIDFQDLRPGPSVYDLVSFLEDAYTSLPQALRFKLFHYYLELNPEALGKKSKREEFVERYHRMAVQRLFKAVGSFARASSLKKDNSYLPHIGLCLERIRQILYGHPGGEKLGRALFEIVYERAD